MAVAAANKLLQRLGCEPESVDFILLCTQTPDYFLPTTACLVQDRLGIPTQAGTLDFNLGCSGYIYGLGLAKGLIETGQARRILLLTAETYSKFIHHDDRSVRTIFGDAAAATLIVESQTEPVAIGPFVYRDRWPRSREPHGEARRNASSPAHPTLKLLPRKRTGFT